ncbi:hypothetical protein HYFRA_00003328 [Hymenoscyphus fraxineus]|uniref:Uncharacterized protein n=1 Tax=Hymenoscyphus fraxineus TaxID=746836 RepID=A0A9N9KW08_9HELO|nr:hypothetical protein HYFRA_00003328 [Hymenoscyphus fraxineus]
MDCPICGNNSCTCNRGKKRCSNKFCAYYQLSKARGYRHPPASDSSAEMKEEMGGGSPEDAGYDSEKA